jgi:acyl CoA:acetate/3-ketoacid CoA transferase alpha subunit
LWCREEYHGWVNLARVSLEITLLTFSTSGFGLSGIPENIIEYVYLQDDITDLRIVSTEAGDDSWGLSRLIQKGKVAKQWASFIGKAHAMEKAYLAGDMELELIPQGTVSSLIHASFRYSMK